MVFSFRNSNSIQEIGDDGCEFLLVFDDGNFNEDSTFLITDWFKHVPPSVLGWHPNADEWQYYIAGEVRMGVFGASEEARTFDYRAGDVGYVPFAMGHYIENTGNETLRFLEMFRSPVFIDLSLNQWMALTPHEPVQGHLKLDDGVMQALRKSKLPIVPA